jgi:polyadenylate-binding protein
LLVRNLAQEVTQKEFHEFFKSHGNVRSTKIETFSDGKSRGFGYVLYETAEMAQKVLSLDKDKLLLGGKNFEVFLHQPKDKRREGGAADAKFTNLFV